MHRQAPQFRLRSKLAIEVLEDRACPSPIMLVSSRDIHAVLKYDGLTGAYLGDFIPSGYGGLRVPMGQVIAADGTFLISSWGTHEVLRYDLATGEFLGAFVTAASGGLFNPHGLGFGPDGHLYVSSAESRSILRYDGNTGEFLDAFVPAASGGLTRPTGLIFGPDGHLYVNSFDDNSVKRYDGLTGEPLPAPDQSGATFVVSGSGGLDHPNMGITFGADGLLYVGGLYSNDVLRYDPTTGKFLDAFVPRGSGQLWGTHGIAFGPDGHFYVSSEYNDRVLRYDGATGQFLDAFVPPGGGGLNRPTYLLFYDDGRGAPSPGSVPRFSPELLPLPRPVTFVLTGFPPVTTADRWTLGLDGRRLAPAASVTIDSAPSVPWGRREPAAQVDTASALDTKAPFVLVWEMGMHGSVRLKS